MKKRLLLNIIVCISGYAYAQLPPVHTPASQYIEGAKVVIDILQLLKKTPSSKLAPQKENLKGSYCNFCLFNSDSTQKIKVTITSKNLPLADTSIMVIRPREKECSLQIRCGIYNCKIQSLEEKLISWGDILINEKEILITK